MIPYPKYCSPVLINEKDDLFFKGILYFAMINANLASSYNQETVEQDLYKISLLSGFNQHKLLSSTEFSKEYDQMIEVLDENGFLYILILVFLISGGIFIETLLSFEIIKKRMNIYLLYRELGLQRNKKDFIITELVPCFFSSIIAMYLIHLLFSNTFNYIIIFLIVLLISFIIFIICYRIAYILNMKLIKGEGKL